MACNSSQTCVSGGSGNTANGDHCGQSSDCLRGVCNTGNPTNKFCQGAGTQGDACSAPVDCNNFICDPTKHVCN
jgi:hypothetical protein